MRLLLVRHAESQGNREMRLQGRREFPLTRRGLDQARALADRLAKCPPTAIYASPITRAARTAEAVAERCGLSVAADPRLEEYDFGEASGLTWTEIGVGAKPARASAWLALSGSATKCAT